jgi:hypothetical protein
MAEPKKEKKPKKPVRTPALEEFGRELTPKGMEKISGARARINALMESAPGALAGSAAGAVAAEATDPYLSRNEFKEGFYDQPKPPGVDYSTRSLKGTASGKTNV